MSDKIDSTRRRFLKATTVGSAMVPTFGTAAAQDGGNESTSFTISKSGSAGESAGTVSEKRRRELYELMEELGETDSKPKLKHAQTTNHTIGTHQKLPTERPGEEVWSEDFSEDEETITGADLLRADFFLSCYHTDVFNDEGKRYMMWYAWAGIRPQDKALWTGNLEEAYIQIKLTSDNGNMIQYQPGGDQSRAGKQVDLSLQASGQPGGVGGTAQLASSFTIGGGTVRPHRWRMDMSQDRFAVAFDGQTEATTEMAGMAMGTREPDGGEVTWDYDVHLSGDRYNKCPIICDPI